MNIESVFKNLERLNLKVDNSSKFFEVITTYKGGSSALFKKLEELNNNVHSDINYEKYEEKVIEFLDKIQSTINKDGLFNLTDEIYIKNFKVNYQKIINKNIFIHRLEDERKLNKENLKEIEKIKNDIKDVKGSYELSRLHSEYQRRMKIVQSSSKKIEEYAKKVADNSKKASYTGLIDGLLRDCSSLAENLKDLTLTKETKDKVNYILLDMAKYFSEERQNIKGELVEYLELLDKAGLEKNIEIEKTEEVELPKEAVKESPKKEIKIEPEIKEEKKDTLKEEQPIKKETVKETTLKVGDIVYYNGTFAYDNYSDISRLNIEEPYKITKTGFDDKGNEIYYLDGNDNPVSVTLLETESEKFNKETSLHKGDKVYFSGINDYNKYNVKLEVGKEYIIDRATLDEKGDEIYFLEGIDNPVSVMSLVTDKRWNEYMESLVNKRVINVSKPSKRFNKKELYLESLTNISEKPAIGLSIKKAFSSVINKVKNKIDEIKKDLAVSDEFEEIKEHQSYRTR